MNSIWAVSVSHKSVSIEKLGQLIPNEDNLSLSMYAHLEMLKKELNLSGLMVLNTCNRLLFIFSPLFSDNNIDLQQLYSLYNPHLDSEKTAFFIEKTRVFRGKDAVKHVFEVACSVNSLVVGEREILRQLRQSYDTCRKNKLTDDNIRLLIESAIPVAKEVYTKTKIGENSVSVVSLAIRELMKRKPNLSSKILIIGTGQTNTLVAKFLLKNEFKNFTIFNRTTTNGESMGRMLKTKVQPLSELENFTKDFDILITCTGATSAIITENLYSKIAKTDKKRIIIDLAVPHNVADEVIENFDTDYINVEKLRELANYNHELRKKEILHAQSIIANRTKDFGLLIRERRVEKAMAQIPAKVKAIKVKAVDNVFQKDIAQMDEQSQETLLKVINYLEKKYIGIPISVAKKALVQEINN